VGWTCRSGLLSGFAVFTDLLGYMRKLNLNLLDKNQFLYYLCRHILAFKTKLFLLLNQISKTDFSHFQRL
jgi:hypothetical protein